MRRHRTKPHASHDRWLVSYADFITLLFAFFVVLYSSSKADSQKQAAIAGAIDSAFRSLGLFQAPSKRIGSASAALPHNQEGAATPVNIVLGDQFLATQGVKADFERLRKNLEGLLANQIAQHVVAIRIGRDGLIISLREAGFFDSGTALPQPSTLPVLNQIAGALHDTPYDIRIEGHTDNVPIHTAQFESNWELSTARATRLARLFVVDHNYAPERLSASGYAEYHPVADNATPEGRGQNRRVDIIVLPRTSSAPPPPEHDVPATNPLSIHNRSIAAGQPFTRSPSPSQ